MAASLPSRVGLRPPAARRADRGRTNVVGTLRVIDHAADVVGGVFVPAWVEVRVEE